MGFDGRWGSAPRGSRRGRGRRGRHTKAGWFPLCPRLHLARFCRPCSELTASRCSLAFSRTQLRLGGDAHGVRCRSQEGLGQAAGHHQPWRLSYCESLFATNFTSLLPEGTPGNNRMPEAPNNQFSGAPLCSFGTFLPQLSLPTPSPPSTPCT